MSAFVRQRRPAGFTLVEVLVALSVLAVLSLMSFMGVTSLIATEERTRESAAQMKAIERLLAEFENDVLFAVPRGAWSADNEFEPALSVRQMAGQGDQAGGYKISFSHFSGFTQAAPYRMTYLFVPPRVEVILQPQLDALADSRTPAVTVLEGLRAVGIRFLDADDRWTQTWSPSRAASSTEDTTTLLPRAVELTLDIEGLGRITRLVARP